METTISTVIELLLIVIGSTAIISSIGYLLYKINKLSQINQELSKKLSKQITIETSQSTIDFLDKILLIKFQYYLNTYIVAYFISEKEIDKKEIKQLKEEFYLDVSKTLCENTQQQILKVFSKEGTILYIHQTFLRLLNDANIKFRSGDATINNMSRRTLEAVYQ